MAEKSEHKTEKAHKNPAKKYAIKPSFADNGAPRFAVGQEEEGKFHFLQHVDTEALAEQTITDYEERDKHETEEQKHRDQARDANKAAGFHAAEKRGEFVAPENKKWTEQHDASVAR